MLLLGISLAVSIFWIWLTRRLALARGLRHRRWMLAAAFLGPLPLLVILVWPKSGAKMGAAA
jgi:hypothetical protein